MEESMKRRLLSMLTCLVLLLTMIPAGVFADDTGDALQPGLYWRKTQRSHNESGDMVFEPVGDPQNTPIVGETNNDAIREFVYVDESGSQSTVKFGSGAGPNVVKV